MRASIRLETCKQNSKDQIHLTVLVDIVFTDIYM